MPTTKVLKPTPLAEVPRRPANCHPGSGPRLRPANCPATGSRAAAQSNGSSYPRCPRREAQEAASSSGTTAPSSSAAPRRPRPPPQDHRRPARPVRPPATDTVKGEPGPTRHSQKAFTVIRPNPQKRQEIQRKAEAELAALEELRLSRATAYVSVNPSSVGGCLSLEEVRLRQQQDMTQAKRKPKQVKKLTEEANIPTS